MNITLPPHAMCGTLDDVVASKSLAHRALICAAFADKTTKIECNSASADIIATVGVLRSMGASIDIDGNIYTVTPISRIPQTEIEIDFGESGSTMRFILPILGALGVKAKMITHGRLTSRPLSPLYEELLSHGMKLSEQGKCPLYCDGKLCGKNYAIDGGVSSQFVSGLLFALAVSDGGSVAVKGKLESASYIDLTTDMLKKFGADISCTENIYTVGGKKLVSPEYIRIEGDWSNAAFWLAAGALSERGVTVSPLEAKSIQGDRAIADILFRFGADVTYNEKYVAVKRRRLEGITVDAANIPDLVPVISIVAAASRGTTTIQNIARLRFKESDRVATVCEMLENLGIETEADENTLIVHGGKIQGGTVNSHNDHRIAMSAAVASCVSADKITILGAEAVAKSYPDFFEKAQTLGAQPCRQENT